jgi:HEAT repeat protein
VCSSDLETELIQLLIQDDKSTKLAAASALGNIGNKTGLPTALQLSSDNDNLIRAQAVETLGIIGDVSTIPTLEKIFNTDTDNYVKETARTSLYRLGWKPQQSKPVKKETKK